LSREPQLRQLCPHGVAALTASDLTGVVVSELDDPSGERSING